MIAVRQRLSRAEPERAKRRPRPTSSSPTATSRRGTRTADDGANRNARVKATNAMMQFYDANKNITAAGKYVVEAAYNVARMRAGDGHELRRVAPRRPSPPSRSTRRRAGQRRQERSDGLARGRHGGRGRLHDVDNEAEEEASTTTPATTATRAPRSTSSRSTRATPATRRSCRPSCSTSSTLTLRPSGPPPPSRAKAASTIRCAPASTTRALRSSSSPTTRPRSS